MLEWLHDLILINNSLFVQVILTSGLSWLTSRLLNTYFLALRLKFRKMTGESVRKHGAGLVNFINSSPSPFHVVNNVRKRLTSVGFKEIREEDSWSLKPNDKVFLTRNESTIVALTIGGKYKPGNGFSMIGAHTDSPCLKVKPISERLKEGYIQLGVETYGGGIWFTWFDRDLTVAGRCITKNSTSGSLSHKLVHIQRPILRIPTLAIHLDRTVNDSFTPNKENHLAPLLCTAVKDKLLNENKCQDETSSTQSKSKCHPSALMRLLAKEMNVSEDDIIDVEVCLADTQIATIGGIYEEFIFAPRLDNLFNSYASIEALVESLESLPQDSNIRLACLYDNEEVGSQSAQGAQSSITELLLRRVTASVNPDQGRSPTAYEEAIAKSYLLSADQAHAVHPNYDDKHEKSHKPALHAGIVLKQNANQRYATTAITKSIIKEVATVAEVPLQEFVIRQDSVCGSTIGPIMAAKLGIATSDVGGPQLSMHSCREMCCTSSVSQAVQLYKTFFEMFPQIRDNLRYE